MFFQKLRKRKQKELENRARIADAMRHRIIMISVENDTLDISGYVSCKIPAHSPMVVHLTKRRVYTEHDEQPKNVHPVYIQKVDGVWKLNTNMAYTKSTLWSNDRTQMLSDILMLDLRDVPITE